MGHWIYNIIIIMFVCIQGLLSSVSYSTGKCILMSSLHGCGTELIVYCSVSLNGIASNLLCRH